MKAYKVNETIGNILQPKSREEIMDLLKIDKFIPKLDEAIEDGIEECKWDLEDEPENIEEDMPRYVGSKVGDAIGYFYSGFPSDPVKGEDYMFDSLQNFIFSVVKRKFPKWDKDDLDTFWEYVGDQLNFH